MISDYFNSQEPNYFISFLIIISSSFMTATIYFYSQSQLWTVKIQNISPYRFLSNKSISQSISLYNHIPKQPLSFRGNSSIGLWKTLEIIFIIKIHGNLIYKISHPTGPPSFKQRGNFKLGLLIFIIAIYTSPAPPVPPLPWSLA